MNKKKQLCAIGIVIVVFLAIAGFGVGALISAIRGSEAYVLEDCLCKAHSITNSSCGVVLAFQTLTETIPVSGDDCGAYLAHFFPVGKSVPCHVSFSQTPHILLSVQLPVTLYVFFIAISAFVACLIVGYTLWAVCCRRDQRTYVEMKEEAEV